MSEHEKKIRDGLADIAYKSLMRLLDKSLEPDLVTIAKQLVQVGEMALAELEERCTK